jgi:hypothetical protein
MPARTHERPISIWYVDVEVTLGAFVSKAHSRGKLGEIGYLERLFSSRTLP